MGLAIRWKAVLLMCLGLAFAVPGLADALEAEGARFPTQPINFILSLPAGSAGDMASRLISKEAEAILGKPIIIVNKPGGAHTIATATIAKAKPDGYTIGYVPPSPLFTVPFFEKLNYNPIEDLQAIIQYGEMRFGVITAPNAPFKTFKEMIEYARKNPGKMTYGTGGQNSIANISMEKIAREEHVRFTHIPFKASTEYQTALLGGHVMFSAGEVNASLLEAGELRLLLLFTEQRLPEYPQVPVLKELGYKTSYPSLLAVMGPKGMPPGVLKKLEDAYTTASRQPKVIKGMSEMHLSMVYRNSRELTDYVIRNHELYGQMIKEMNLGK